MLLRARRLVRALPLLTLVLGLLGAPRPAPAADDPRLVRLEVDLAALEALTARLDHVTTLRNQQLTRRVELLDQRLRALEQRHGLPGGVISRRGGFAFLLDDVTRLGARLKHVLRAEAMAAGPAQDLPAQRVLVPAAPPPAGAAAPPAKAAPGAWPASLRFNATANVNYEATGSHVLLGPTWIQGWQSTFLQDGWRGSISFSLRARGLVRTVRAAQVRVVVRLAAPFAPGGAWYRVYDVLREAQRALHDNALKDFPNHDPIEIRGPFTWLDRPSRGVTRLEVEAHVLALTLADGSLVTFQAPEFVPR